MIYLAVFQNKFVYKRMHMRNRYAEMRSQFGVLELLNERTPARNEFLFETLKNFGRHELDPLSDLAAETTVPIKVALFVYGGIL